MLSVICVRRRQTGRPRGGYRLADQFDPYYTWLGIPPEEQPPDHYRLLGLRRAENNREVIENACFRVTAYLRTLQLGPHLALSQKLLNEVAAAKACLLDPDKKALYDASLARPAGDRPMPPPLPAWLDAGHEVEPLRVPAPRQPWSFVAMSIAVVLGLFLVVAILWMLLRIWDANSGQEEFNLEMEKATVTQLAFSPRGDRLLVVTEDRICLWDLRSGREIEHYPFDAAAAFSPDGSMAVFSRQRGSSAYLYRLPAE